MSRRCMGIMFLLIGGSSFFLLSGCLSDLKKQTTSDAADLTEACGIGESIEARCVVSFYSGTGSKYISEQKHTICPASKRITIHADEPQGSFIWELSGGDFEILKGTASSGSVPKTSIDRATARIILTSVLAGGGFLLESGRSLEPAKIEGQWYRPIELSIDPPNSWARLRLFQNMASMKIDMVMLEDSEQKISLIARSYNYRSISAIGRSLPTKIDVFSTDNSGFPLQQLLQIDYQRIGAY